MIASLLRRTITGGAAALNLGNNLVESSASGVVPAAFVSSPSGFCRGDVFIRPTSLAPIPEEVTDYQRGIATLRESLAADEVHHLQEQSKSFLLAHETLPERGTLVLFHGWSAGAWQFEEMAQRFYDAGYTVYAPRLPGHGYAGNDNQHDNSRLPKADQSANYEAYVEKIHSRIAELPGPKSVVGFSGGGAIAMRSAERYGDIEKAVLIAPFLRPKKSPARFLNRVVTVLDPLTSGGMGRLIDQIPFTMSRSGTTEGLERGCSGHAEVSVGNIHALAKFGAEVLKDADKASAKVQFILSRSDRTSDDASMEELFSRLGDADKHKWFEFSKDENVPHTMVHPKERGCPKEKTDKVFDVARGFLTGE